jgi:hypothetical protein
VDRIRCDGGEIVRFAAEIADGRGNNVLWLRKKYNKFQAEALARSLRGLVFSEIWHEGAVARLESPLRGDEHYILRELSQLLGATANATGFGRELREELYAAKYVKGNYVPWHRDMPRHKIVAMVYCGEFRGGAYVYEDNRGHAVRCVVGEGDVLICVNESRGGVRLDSVHRVERICFGERFVAMGSLVAG